LPATLAAALPQAGNVRAASPLPLHQLAQQLHDGEDQAYQAPLDRLRGGPPAGAAIPGRRRADTSQPGIAAGSSTAEVLSIVPRRAEIKSAGQ